MAMGQCKSKTFGAYLVYLFQNNWVWVRILLMFSLIKTNCEFLHWRESLCEAEIISFAFINSLPGVQEIVNKCVKWMTNNTNNSLLLILSNGPSNFGGEFQPLKFLKNWILIFRILLSIDFRFLLGSSRFSFCICFAVFGSFFIFLPFILLF